MADSVEELISKYEAALKLVEKQQEFNETLLESFKKAQAEANELEEKLLLAKDTLEWFSDENNYKPLMRVDEEGKMIDYVSGIEQQGVDKAVETLYRVSHDAV